MSLAFFCQGRAVFSLPVSEDPTRFGPVVLIGRSRFEKGWMLQAFCVNAELTSDLNDFETITLKFAFKKNGRHFFDFWPINLLYTIIAYQQGLY